MHIAMPGRPFLLYLEREGRARALLVPTLGAVYVMHVSTLAG